MRSESSIRFHAGEIELDGRLSLPPGATRACVVCHPHPLYGGDMHAGVVVAITEALRSGGVATLRFDFRGVGRSGGVHGGGVGEVDDARAAVRALAAASGVPGVAIAGYSFGSLVALRVAAGGNATAVAAIAPPLLMFDAAFVAALDVPLLLLAGDRDEYCRPADFEALSRGLPATATATMLAAADHFLAGREGDVGRTVAAWITGL